MPVLSVLFVKRKENATKCYENTIAKLLRFCVNNKLFKNLITNIFQPLIFNLFTVYSKTSKNGCEMAEHFNGMGKMDNNIFQFLSVQIFE